MYVCVGGSKLLFSLKTPNLAAGDSRTQLQIQTEDHKHTLHRMSSHSSSVLISRIWLPVTTTAPTRSSASGTDDSGTCASAATSRGVSSVMMPTCCVCKRTCLCVCKLRGGDSASPAACAASAA